MKRLKESSEHIRWLPNLLADDVQAINFDYLKKQGIKACMFDLDHTLLVHGEIDMSKKTANVLKKSGMKLYIATNRRYSEELDAVAKQIDADGIMHARSRQISKPSKLYYQEAIKMTGYKADQVAMIGDRLLQDIWGARRAGITTVLVQKFGIIKWYDQILTIHDRLIPIVFKNSYKKIDS